MSGTLLRRYSQVKAMDQISPLAPLGSITARGIRLEYRRGYCRSRSFFSRKKRINSEQKVFSAMGSHAPGA
jgi:hypothetical protein